MTPLQKKNNLKFNEIKMIKGNKLFKDLLVILNFPVLKFNNFKLQKNIVQWWCKTEIPPNERDKREEIKQIQVPPNGTKGGV